jgi:NAD(P)-dependent dehydrogenase (short-subunit alcohol dehydrogenase family)
MNISSEELAEQLKQHFRAIYRTSQKPAIVRFRKRREGGRILNITFEHPEAEWPEVSYELMNSALLILHHAGLINYGANTVRLSDSLIQTGKLADPGQDATV